MMMRLPTVSTLSNRILPPVRCAIRRLTDSSHAADHSPPVDFGAAAGSVESGELLLEVIAAFPGFNERLSKEQRVLPLVNFRWLHVLRLWFSQSGQPIVCCNWASERGTVVR